MRHYVVFTNSIRFIFAFPLLLAAVFSALGQKPVDVRSLPPNQTVEREMLGGETHRYKFDLQTGEFSQVRVEQKGVDVLLKILGADNQELTRMDSPNDKLGLEILSFVAETSGSYLLEISSLDAKAAKGIYTIRRENSRTASETDRRRIQIERVFVAAIAARDAKEPSEKIIAKLLEALSGWEELKEPVLAEMMWYEAKSLNQETAAELYNEALALAKEKAVDSKRAAAVKFDFASRLYSEAGDKQYQSYALFNSGLVYMQIGEDKKAVSVFNRCLLLKRELGDKLGEAGTLYNLGALANGSGEPQKALNFYNQALPLYRAVADQEGEALTLFGIGKIRASAGEYTNALQIYNQVLKTFRATGNKRLEAIVLNSIGLHYSRLDETTKALASYYQSLKISQEIGNTSRSAETINNIGVIFDSLGEKQKALESYNSALTLYKTIGDKDGESATLNNIGKIHADLKDGKKALEFYNQALIIRRSTGNKRGEAVTLNNLGAVYAETGDLQKSLDFYTQALAIRKSVGDKAGEAMTLSNIGRTHGDLRNFQKALENFYESLLIRRVIGDKSGEAETLGSLRILWAFKENPKNNPRLAIFFGKQSIGNFQELRQEKQSFDSDTQKVYLKSIENRYKKLAENLMAENRLAEAQQVLNLYQDQQFFDYDRNPADAVKQVIKTPREEILSRRYGQISETVSKIGEQVGNLKREIENRQPTAEESRRLKRLEGELKIASDEFLAIFKQAETEFAKPPDAKDKIPNAADLNELQAALRDVSAATSQKTVAIYTLVGTDNFRTLLVTADGIKSFENPVKGDELNEKILQFYALLQTPTYDPRILGKELYDIIFKPLEKDLPKDTATIIWALDGSLRYIPMATLHDGEKYLVERFQTAIFTRADRQRMIETVSPNWTGLGFGSSKTQTVDLLGDGDRISFAALPGVTAELKMIFQTNQNKTALLGGEVFTDERFTKNLFVDSLKQKRPLVHISSHFAFRPGDDTRSFLLLGDGTALTLNEMKKQGKLFDGVELLTLSACNTAATQADASGREIDGFAELAQRLGAGAVMATLWQVSDASTPWLMRDFYATRQSTNKTTKAESLRKAQTALLNGTAETQSLPEAEKGEASKIKVEIVPDNTRLTRDGTRDVGIVRISAKAAPLFKKDEKNKPFAHPYYWSPFVLIGNWK